MRCGGTRRPSGLPTLQGRRPWGRLGAPVATLPHGIGTGKAEEGEKDTRKGLTGGVHIAATKRRGGWQAGRLAVLGRKAGRAAAW
jgi:hypothetical protein